ncbi:FIG085779: Lipoprotein, partial [Pseudomonas sp. FEN]
DPSPVAGLPPAAERLRQPRAAARTNADPGPAAAIAHRTRTGRPAPGLVTGDPARGWRPALVADGPAGHPPGPPAPVGRRMAGRRPVATQPAGPRAVRRVAVCPDTAGRAARQLPDRAAAATAACPGRPLARQLSPGAGVHSQPAGQSAVPNQSVERDRPM